MWSTHFSLSSLPGHTSVVLLFLCRIIPSRYYAFSYILLLVYPLRLQAYLKNNITLQLCSMSLAMFVFPYCSSWYRYHHHLMIPFLLPLKPSHCLHCFHHYYYYYYEWYWSAPTMFGLTVRNFLEFKISRLAYNALPSFA